MSNEAHLIKESPSVFSAKCLSGSWTTEELHNMISKFNNLPAACNRRISIMHQLLSAQNILFLIFRCWDEIVPKRCFQLDLIAVQLNSKRREFAANQSLNVTGALFGNWSDQELAHEFSQLHQRAVEKGTIPELYQRKYPENPVMFADLNYSLEEIQISKEGVSRKIPLAIHEIAELKLSQAKQESYVDLKILTT